MGNKGDEITRWYSLWFFDELTIRYGTSVDDITIVGKKLYDKNTGEQILLVDGPNRGVLDEEDYEITSLHLYRYILQVREGSSNSGLNGVK